METNNLYCMCRLCLFRNKNLIDIFEMNSLHGYVVAEIISDLLSLQVTEDDGYPRVVCERCLEKLNEFKVFKEVCYTLKSTYDNLFCNRRASSQNEVVNIEPLVKLEPEENDAKESEDYHEAMYPNPEIIMCDRISEMNSQSEILVEQEGISSDEMSLSSVVKEEPKEEEIEVMESQPKELFHVSGDEFGDPVRQNVIFHSQMSMGSVHSVPSSHNHLEQREDSTGETLQNIGEGQNRLVSYVKSQRGYDQLVFGGYLYRSERRASGTIYWQCTCYRTVKCHGRVCMTNGMVTKSTPHNHPPDPGKIQEKYALETMRPRRPNC